MEESSKLVYIDDVPKDPVNMFSELLEAQKSSQVDLQYVPMNIATLDSEFGVINRTVVYRGLTDNQVTFVTEKNSRKYQNILENPKVSVTILLGAINYKGGRSTWQVRLFGEAVELSSTLISNLWTKEPVFAKIRSRICECGKPIDHAVLKDAHDNLLKAYESGHDTLPQTETYTAFKIIPTIWDFYKSELNCVADRVQYQHNKSGGETWNIMHVAA